MKNWWNRFWHVALNLHGYISQNTPYIFLLTRRSIIYGENLLAIGNTMKEVQRFALPGDSIYRVKMLEWYTVDAPEKYEQYKIRKVE